MPGHNALLLQRASKGSFTCQGHRQLHTKLHVYIATEPPTLLANSFTPKPTGVWV